MAKRNFFIAESELDDFQVKILRKKIENSFIVKGCAGSGKSILALWKIKQIHESGNGSYLFVVYTKALAKYMEDGIKSLGLDTNRFKNYNKCFDWSSEDSDGNRIAKWKEGDVDYIIVDEAQDMGEDDILLLQKHAKKALILYGDSVQQLYTALKPVISMEDIQRITGYTDEKLVFNHRLPKKIARLAEKVSEDSDELEDRCKLEGEEKPKILHYQTYEEQLDAIINIVRNKNLEDVGILFSSNNEASKARNYFIEKEFYVEAKVGNDLDLNFNSTNPKLLTYHSSKGLQFETVFLPECSYSFESKGPLYVAITRSYKSLYIMYTDSLSCHLQNLPPEIFEATLSKKTEDL